MTGRVPALRRGRLALVTGASSGIGETFATVLAERGLDLALTARSEDRLRVLADLLAARHGIEAHVIPLDLAERGAPARLFAATEERGLQVDVLVNNAGLGAMGSFVGAPLERHLTLMRVNVEALASLSRLYLPAMLERRAGAIVNVSSIAGFQPIPHFALYGASKTFVTSFTTALWDETRGTGVRVTAVAPGPVAETRFGLDDGGGSGLFRAYALPRRAVVETALRGLERDEPIVVPGALNALEAAAVRLVPRWPLLVFSEVLLRGLGRARERALSRAAERRGAP